MRYKIQFFGILVLTCLSASGVAAPGVSEIAPEDNLRDQYAPYSGKVFSAYVGPALFGGAVQTGTWNFGADAQTYFTRHLGLSVELDLAERGVNGRVVVAGEAPLWARASYIDVIVSPLIRISGSGFSGGEGTFLNNRVANLLGAGLFVGIPLGSFSDGQGGIPVTTPQSFTGLFFQLQTRLALVGPVALGVRFAAKFAMGAYAGGMSPALSDVSTSLVVSNF